MFGDDLRDARERAGVSIAELAERSHTSRAAITDYETNRKQPRIDTADRILRALGRTLAPVSLATEPASWRPPLDVDAVAAIETARVGRETSIARTRRETAEIVEAYATAERLDLTWGAIKTIVDGWSVAGDPVDVRRAQLIARSIRQTLDAAGAAEPRALTAVVNGSLVADRPTLAPVARALDWLARALTAGADATLASTRANGLLVHHGYAWVYPPYRLAAEYRRALVVCADGGDAGPLSRVLAASIDDVRLAS
ncbi:helix-turn-helix transcriptional regulator [Frondihabitans australicus]|uniref:Helix-turn-helix protein n=1 Tax=Frondihabitans australicus TaxID=386892 RepID=A0A495IEG7_9MICO|nr:helix-turn-helix transcriptional regulator [Frondihabitans australicus]RKR73406.1 helix-turn-helix protein [Frondihabitans australicus]